MRIPTHQKEVIPTRQSPDALMQPGYATQEFWALARAGEAVSGLGETLGKMYMMDVQTNIMNANSEFETNEDTLKFSDRAFRDTYGDGTYTDSAGQVVKKKPRSQFAEDFEKAQEKAINDIDQKYLAGKAPGSVRAAWLIGARTKGKFAVAKANNIEYQMIQTANELAFHKQAIVLSNSLDAKVVTSATPEEAMNELGAFEASIDQSAADNLVDIGTTNKLKRDARVKMARAAEAHLKKSILDNREDEARKSLLILKGLGAIDEEEYNTRLKELPANIVLSQAERMLLSGRPAQAIDTLEALTNRYFSKDQLKAKNDLLAAAKEQIKKTTIAASTSVVFGMADNDDKLPAKKMELGKQYKEQLRAANLTPAEARTMIDRIDKWSKGTDAKTDLALFAELAQDVRSLNKTSSGEDVGRVSEKIHSKGGKLSNANYKSLTEMLGKRLEKGESDAIQRVIKTFYIDEETQGFFTIAMYKKIQDRQEQKKPMGPRDIFIEGAELAATLFGTTPTGSSEYILMSALGDEAALPEPKTEAEFDKLPSGAKYKAPDGTIRTKP